MKCLVHVGALGLTLQVDSDPIIGPDDPLYEARCIKLDAERAWKMREPLEKALSWPKGTKQYGLWMAAYEAAQGAA